MVNQRNFPTPQCPTNRPPQLHSTCSIHSKALKKPNKRHCKNSHQRNSRNPSSWTISNIWSTCHQPHENFVVFIMWNNLTRSIWTGMKIIRIVVYILCKNLPRQQIGWFCNIILQKPTLMNTRQLVQNNNQIYWCHQTECPDQQNWY